MSIRQVFAEFLEDSTKRYASTLAKSRKASSSSPRATDLGDWQRQQAVSSSDSEKIRLDPKCTVA